MNNNREQFVLDNPSIARGYLKTAQSALAAALRHASEAIGGLDVALPVWVGPDAPPNRLHIVLGSVEDAISKMVTAAKALEALRGTNAKYCSCDPVCTCDAYSANHLPGRGNCPMPRR